MHAWLIDAYRSKNQIILWIKTPEKNIRLAKPYKTSIYLEYCQESETFIKKHNLPHYIVKRQHYLRHPITVIQLFVPSLEDYEKFVRWIERETKHQVNLYNADIPPEQMYLYEHQLGPGQPIELRGETVVPLHHDDAPIPLRKMELDIKTQNDEIAKITANDTQFSGNEQDLLRDFSRYLQDTDPDVIIMEHAFAKIPKLAARFDHHKLGCPLNRWDATPLTYKGGKSYYSYGKIHYQDHAIRLKGRFLIDTTTFMGGECEVEAIMELCQITGTRFQILASRTFGAAFHSYLVKLLVEHDLLVPYKEKPIERPMSLIDFVKADRVGHTFDPKVGFHKHVAELDFASMYPWIMYNHNISADTLLSTQAPLVSVPELPITISHHHKGIIPKAILPFIERRMKYKQNPTALNKTRAAGLKWVLVSSYGYLRYREFKLGIARSHMAVGAYARETLLKSAELAYEHGYELIHGIIDSLYLHKKDMTVESVRAFSSELAQHTGIPVSFEGIFKWVVFLPSIRDKDRPLPARYFGVFQNGELKVRGIELRQRGTPLLIKYFQKKVLETMAQCSERAEIVAEREHYCQILREFLVKITTFDPKWLICSVRMGRETYDREIPQKQILDALNQKGEKPPPGVTVKFIHGQDKAVLPDSYDGRPNTPQYKKMLVRALYVLLQPFDTDEKFIIERIADERQATIEEFA